MSCSYLPYGGVLLLLAVSPVAAQTAKPSFDCATAKTGAEIAICADRSLARLDREIASAYGSIIDALPEDTRRRLREDQRHFLRDRDIGFEIYRDAEELAELLQARGNFLRRMADSRNTPVHRSASFENAQGTVSFVRTETVAEVSVQTAGPGGRWTCDASVTVRPSGARWVGTSEEGLTLTIRMGDGYLSVSATGVAEAGVCGNNGTLDGDYFFVGSVTP